MPHVIVKMYPGRTGEQKSRIAEEITKAVMASANSAEHSISVSIEDIQPDQWVEQVYRPDILARMDRVYKKPGYNPL